jgi:hypothetical protein
MISNNGWEDRKLGSHISLKARKLGSLRPER